MASVKLDYLMVRDPQTSSVFFTKVPKEIRDQVFDLAITHEKRETFFSKDVKYSRPGFRHNGGRISTALLRTCQRIYEETCHLPAHRYTKIDWYIEESHDGHGPNDPTHESLKFPSKMQNLHIYTQSCDLKAAASLEFYWGTYLNQVSAQGFNLQYLKITLGHNDSAWLDDYNKLTLPKPEPWSNRCPEYGWGWHIQIFKNLTRLDVEAETTTERMEELNEVVAGAAEWRFPVASGNILVLNPRKTRKEGWHGPVLTEPRYVSDGALDWENDPQPTKLSPPPDAAEAKEKLIENGVEFVEAGNPSDQASGERLTFYAVTLVVEAEKPQKQDVGGLVHKPE